MDATSIITNISADDEQLNVYSNDRENVDRLKSPRRGFLRSILCCWRQKQSKINRNSTTIDGSTTPPPITDQQRYLLPQIRYSDMHKKCMVIDLDETLVHSSFKPIPNADFIVPVEIDGTIHQVYVLKRPHVDEFLKKMGELYECVLFTASLAKYADPVADLLDRWNVFRARLFRESCVYYRGNYIKDLNRLGRDLQKIVIVDNSPASYIFHPDNAVPVKSWFDDVTDSELLELIPLFEKLSKVDSVYSVLCNSNKPSNGIQDHQFEQQQQQQQQQHQQQSLDENCQQQQNQQLTQKSYQRTQKVQRLESLPQSTSQSLPQLSICETPQHQNHQQKPHYQSTLQMNQRHSPSNVDDINCNT